MHLTAEDLKVIGKKVDISTFDALPLDEKKRLLKKWKSETHLTMRDIPPIHNDGDRILRPGKDF